MQCFLDMDGVVADFVKAAFDLHKVSNPYEKCRGDKAWDIMKHVPGISPADFWGSMDREFWSNMEKTPEADFIVDACVEYFGEQSVCFLTSPVDTPGCLDGKRDWASKHYPNIPILFSQAARGEEHIRRPPKHFLAAKNKFLIDDHTPNVDTFALHGGEGFLLPRPWNRLHFLETDLQQVLAAYLESFVELREWSKTWGSK